MLNMSIPGHMAYMITTLLLTIIAAHLFLLWHRRWMQRNDLGATGRAAGLYSAAWAIAFALIIEPSLDPIRLVFERMGTMALSPWEVSQYVAFHLAIPILVWFLVMRLVLFVFGWLNGPGPVATMLKEEQYGRVIPLTATMVLASWLIGKTLAPVMAGYLPYPEIPLFK